MSRRTTREQQRALDRLAEAPCLSRFYLAGGVAVAAHVDHRTSVDLDLFSLDASVDLESVRLRLVSELPELEVVAATEAMIGARIGEVPLDLVRYPYAPLIPPLADIMPVPVASPLDLATMKLSAIARRGLRRDFWDLMLLAQRPDITLRGALDAFVRRFGRSDSDLYHVIRSLTFFDQAEAEATWPAGLTPEAWQSVKAWFEGEAPAELRRRLDQEV